MSDYSDELRTEERKWFVVSGIRTSLRRADLDMTCSAKFILSDFFESWVASLAMSASEILESKDSYLGSIPSMCIISLSYRPWAAATMAILLVRFSISVPSEERTF